MQGVGEKELGLARDVALIFAVWADCQLHLIIVRRCKMRKPYWRRDPRPGGRQIAPRHRMCWSSQKGRRELSNNGLLKSEPTELLSRRGNNRDRKIG